MTSPRSHHGAGPEVTMLSAHPSLSACHAHAQSIVSTALAFARQRALDNATALVKAREFVSEVPPRIGRGGGCVAVVLHDRLGFGLMVDTNPWQVSRLIDLCPGVARIWGFDASGELRWREDRTEYQCAGLEARPGCRDEVDLYIANGLVGGA